jgi:hypothetical protein
LALSREERNKRRRDRARLQRELWAAEAAEFHREFQERLKKHDEHIRQRDAAKQAFRDEVERVNAAHNRQATAFARDALVGSKIAKHLNGKAE